MIFALLLISPASFTEPVEFDADDPAVLYNAAAPDRSLIVGTDKEKAPGGGLYAFNLEGKVVGRFSGVDRPNNVEITTLSNGKTFVLTTERLKNRVRVFTLSFDGTFIDVTGDTEVFRGEAGEDKAPMGIACHGSRVFVTPKAGSITKHLQELAIVENPRSGRIDLNPVRRFGNYTGVKETESIAVDPITNRIYYSDELKGIWCYSLDKLSSPMDFIQNSLHTGDHEGLAFTDKYLVSTDQRKDESVYWLYDRWSRQLVTGFRAPVDETDGIEICTKPLGPRFPKGIMIAMNSKGRNFAIFDLRLFP